MTTEVTVMATRVLSNETSKIEKEAEKELEDFFADCGEGTITVKVFRLDPNYGYSGEFYVTRDNPLKLNEIKNRFGGRVLRLVGRSSNGTFSRQKTITIDDCPKRNGLEIYPDGTVERKPGQGPTQQEMDPWAALLKCPLPPDVMRKIAPYMLGYPVPDENDAKKNPMLETMQQQMMMDMMNTQRQSQMEMMRLSMEMQRDMMKQRTEMDSAMKPKDAFSDVNNVVKLMREMNELKSEFGGDGNPLAAKILEETAGLVDTAVSEFLSLKKMQVQAELARNGSGYEPLARELPERTSGASGNSRSHIRVADSPETDPVELAGRMGRMYSTLSPDQQNRVMSEFFGAQQNIEDSPNDVTIDSDDESMLTPSDQDILNGPDGDKNEITDVPHCEHAAAADDGDHDGGQGNH